MDNIQEKLLFNLLDREMVYVNENEPFGDYKTIFENALEDKKIFTLKEKEEEISNLLIDSEDEYTLITELERMFFYLGFKSAIKYMSSLW